MITGSTSPTLPVRSRHSVTIAAESIEGVELGTVTGDAGRARHRRRLEDADHEGLVRHLLLARDAVRRRAFEAETRVVAGVADHDHERAARALEPRDAFLDESAPDAVPLVLRQHRHRRQAHAPMVASPVGTVTGLNRMWPTTRPSSSATRDFSPAQPARSASTRSASSGWPMAARSIART